MFITDNGPGCSLCGTVHGLHEHHIIPRSCGGIHGPTVYLCQRCHEGIHHAATLGLSPKSYNDKPNRKQTFPSRCYPKAYRLIQAIIRAEKLMAEQARMDRKPVRLSMTLSGDDNARLTALARHRGISKTKMLRYLILAASTSNSESIEFS